MWNITTINPNSESQSQGMVDSVTGRTAIQRGGDAETGTPNQWVDQATGAPLTGPDLQSIQTSQFFQTSPIFGNNGPKLLQIAEQQGINPQTLIDAANKAIQTNQGQTPQAGMNQASWLNQIIRASGDPKLQQFTQTPQQLAAGEQAGLQAEQTFSNNTKNNGMNADAMSFFKGFVLPVAAAVLGPMAMQAIGAGTTAGSTLAGELSAGTATMGTGSTLAGELAAGTAEMGAAAGAAANAGLDTAALNLGAAGTNAAIDAVGAAGAAGASVPSALSTAPGWDPTGVPAPDLANAGGGATGGVGVDMAGNVTDAAGNRISSGTGTTSIAQKILNSGLPLPDALKTALQSAGSDAAAATLLSKALSPAQIAAAGLTNLVGAALTSGAVKQGASIQTAAADNAAKIQQAATQAQVQNLAPYVSAGTTALPLLTAGVQPGGQFNKPYTLADFQAGPQAGLYDFTKQQGLETMSNQMAKGGQGLSTNAITGAGKYATDLASQYYDKGFTENQATNQMALSSTQNLANLGANAAGATNAAIGTGATAQENLGLGTANVQTAATNAQQAPYTSALGTLASNVITNPNVLKSTMDTLSSIFA